MRVTLPIPGFAPAICLAVFNVAVFATPSEVSEFSKFGGAFWVGYIFITLSFIGQLICAYFAFKVDSLQKFFYNWYRVTAV